MNTEAITAICNEAIKLVHDSEHKKPVLKHYWTDVLHDVIQLNKPNAPEHFLWCVKEWGTHLWVDSMWADITERVILTLTHWKVPPIWYIYTPEGGLVEIPVERMLSIING